MTHRFIKSKWLRQAYARELWEARIALRKIGGDDRKHILWGIESGIWAVQKAMAEDMR